jgi:hypothetical protein
VFALIHILILSVASVQIAVDEGDSLFQMFSAVRILRKEDGDWIHADSFEPR